MKASIGTARPDPSAAFALAIASVGLATPLAVHIFMPVIPNIRAAFGITDSTAQLSFSISLATMAFATLVYGTLSDRYGRRPLLLTGLVLFVLGSGLCAIANSIEMLIGGRLLQAAGAGCGVALVRAIARDAYGPDKLVKVIAYLTMFYTLGPALAPLFGGILTDIYGWRSVFWVAFVSASAILAGAYFLIPETRSASDASANAKTPMLRAYVELFSNLRFTAFVMQTGMSSAVFFTMASAASTLMKDLLDRPAAAFGIWFTLFPLGYFLGNFVASRMSGRVSIETMVVTGSVLAGLTTLGQCLSLGLGYVSMLSLFLPGFFITFAQGIALPFSQTGAMAIIPRLSGTASGIGVFLQSFLGAICAQSYGLLADKTVWPLIWVTAIGSIIVLAAGFVVLLTKPRGGSGPISR
jgi:DHA1 family bicyclomycin/chloramphenicol resistance-like MFS transporter